MLKNYYDAAAEERFEKLFSRLKIGREPTKLRNKYLILQWDFSCVDPTGTAQEIKQALHDHVNSCIKAFLVFYRNHVKIPVDINETNAISSLQSLLASVQAAGYPLYLLVDEYDNFANEVMTGIGNERDAYKALTHDKGPLRTLFKAVKSAAGAGTIDRIFIAGVSPVVVSDIASGFNIAEDIFLDPRCNDLCGFTESEVEKILEDEAVDSGFDENETRSALSMMRVYYNGYTFAPGSEQRIYNPTLTIYFMKAFQRFREFPRKMLDANLSTDIAKLEYAAQVPGGRQLILEITRGKKPVTVNDIADRFGTQDMLSDTGKDQGFLKSFLYYFGVLTMTGVTGEGKLVLQVPNMVVRGLYIDRIGKMLLPQPEERDAGKSAAEKLYTKGNMIPLCEFVEQRYFQVFHNPDYKWANELTVKTAFLTLLYNDILYIMDSEREAGRGRADLTMLIRPDMRKYDLFDLIVEFKYVKLGDAGMTGEQARKLTREELQAIPAMVSRMDAACEQLARYGDALEKKYGNLRLRRYAVVSLGFERIWWRELSEKQSSSCRTWIQGTTFFGACSCFRDT